MAPFNLIQPLIYLSKPPNLSNLPIVEQRGPKGKAEGLLGVCTRLILTTDAIPWAYGR